MSKIQDKVLCPIRLPKKDYERVKIKCAEYRISFQKFMYLSILAFLEGDKHIENIISKFVQEAREVKKGAWLDALETHELQKLLEEQSPLNEFNNAVEEFKKEQNVKK